MKSLLRIGIAVASLCVVACSHTSEKQKESVENTPPAVPCQMDYRPVLGSDGITYPNACTAKASGIEDFTPLQSW